jgi:hypothetical protein
MGGAQESEPTSWNGVSYDEVMRTIDEALPHEAVATLSSSSFPAAERADGPVTSTLVIPRRPHVRDLRAAQPRSARPAHPIGAALAPARPRIKVPVVRGRARVVTKAPHSWSRWALYAVVGLMSLVGTELGLDHTSRTYLVTTATNAAHIWRGDTAAEVPTAPTVTLDPVELPTAAITWTDVGVDPAVAATAPPTPAKPKKKHKRGAATDDAADNDLGNVADPSLLERGL